MAIRSRNKVSLEFSMSSMTDIVFLLLIFFIILSTLVSPFGENIKLPSQSVSIPPPNTQNLTVTLRTNGVYMLNERTVSEAQLIAAIQKRKNEQSKPPMVLDVESSVPAGETMKIFSLAQQNDFEVILKAQPRK